MFPIPLLFGRRRECARELLAQRVEAENPERLLRRGYSITTYNGKAVRDAAQLPKGALVETHVEKGKFKSRVE